MVIEKQQLFRFHQWLGLGLLLAVAWGLSRVLETVGHRLGERAARLTASGWDDQLLAAGRGPVRYALVAVLVTAGSRLLAMPPPAQHLLDLGARSLLLVAAAWFVLRFVRLSAHFIEEKVVSGAGADVGRARGLRTQLVVMRRIVEAATYVITASLLLLQFEGVRNVGVSLLASAGLAGLVIGLAAQKSISTLLAGIQLSITQPVRIGDTVIVENEWGWIEEITLTYVVVKVWDLRRLVVPMSHFLDKPFQNWSKGGDSMLGVVRLLVDFSTDLDALRAELRRILDHEGKTLWNGKVATMVVEDVLDRTLQVRVLVSGAPGVLFDLRALVREQLMRYLRERPQWLPTTRTESRAAVAALPPKLEQALEESLQEQDESPSGSSLAPKP